MPLYACERCGFTSAALRPDMTDPTQAEGEAPSVARGPFSVRERVDVDGTLRLTVLGDLDLGVAEVLSERLKELKATGRSVRLDLSQLAFIDSFGVQALLVAISDACCTGWQPEAAPGLSPSVERAAQIVGIAQVLWPERRPDARSDAAHAPEQRLFQVFQAMGGGHDRVPRRRRVVAPARGVRFRSRARAGGYGD